MLHEQADVSVLNSEYLFYKKLRSLIVDKMFVMPNFPELQYEHSKSY